MRNFCHNTQGQGLLELIVAMGIIVSGLVGTLSLTISNQTASQDSADRLVATNIAREGIEVIRNMRDSNWLNCYVDTDRSVTCSNWYDTISAFNDTTAALLFNPATNTWTLDFDALNAISDASARLWRYTTGTAELSSFFQSTSQTPGNASLTKYRRLITLHALCKASGGGITVHASKSDSCDGDDELVGERVQAQAQWEEKGKTLSLTLEERLFNWR